MDSSHVHLLVIACLSLKALDLFDYCCCAFGCCFDLDLDFPFCLVLIVYGMHPRASGLYIELNYRGAVQSLGILVSTLGGFGP